jgi:hypothetical protein
MLAVEQGIKLHSAVLDKSVFHRIAEQAPERQVQIWNRLHTHFQIVVPSILIEEIIVNVADPGCLQWNVIQEMMRCLLRIRPCWMDDVFEIAYRELVQQQPLATLPAFPVEFANRILRLKPDDQELLKWARGRKSDREITARTRVAAQDELLPRERRKEMVDETEFWQLLKNQVLKILGNAERRREFLEKVLGETFRFRHADSVAAIDEAFEHFTDQTYTKYYVSLAILMVRLAYMYAPLIRFKNDTMASPRRFVGRSIADQRNNPGDEQCIVAAMLCDRLITRDEGMNNVTEMFRLNGFTNCRTLYLSPRGEILDQILQLGS